ncbi:MAG: LPXTG cell wall anchor domain-containing protein [Acidobacteriia bacterium]|nr:LPXTG cell wall anchor domain-containing protein [Terriglobia bacterium]
MKRMQTILTLFVVLLLVVTFAASARADTQFNKRTVVTFSQPVEIPGQILPAGTYTIELYETFSYRHIVRIYNADRTQLIATVLAIPNQRLTPTEDTVMKFSERPGNAPDALKAWFYPGDNFGQEFVYPKQRAMELAQITHETIPAVETEPATLPELKSEAIVAETPERTEIAIAEFIPLTGRDTGTLSPIHPLPKTGSQVPLIALFGALSVSFAFVLKRFMS